MNRRVWTVAWTLGFGASAVACSDARCDHAVCMDVAIDNGTDAARPADAAPGDASSDAPSDVGEADSGNTSMDSATDARVDVALAMDSSDDGDAAVDPHLDAGVDTALDTPTLPDVTLPIDATGDGGTDPTRPIAPMSSSAVTSQRPTLRWTVGGTDRAPTSVLLCRDRSLTRDCQSLVAGTGMAARPASALIPGWWFWRLEGTARGSSAPVWQFHVGSRDRAIDSHSGTALDLNGDGFADLAVGAHSDWSSVNGLVHIFMGSAAGIADATSVSITGPDPGDEYGFVVASAGDLNGDGFADLVVGAPASATWRGRVHVYFGSASGVASTTPLTLAGPDPGRGQFGYSAAGAGDVNGDGFGDLAVGAVSASGGVGVAYYYLGTAAGLSTESIQVSNPVGGGSFGWSMASAGDLNGDGYSDLVIGAPELDSRTGSVFVYSGSAAGLPDRPSFTIRGPDGLVGQFGASMTGSGDLNGDGYSDLVVGAPGAMDNTGRAHVFLGGAAGVASTPWRSLTGVDGYEGYFGEALDSAADLNGDGLADLVVGVRRARSDVGRVHVYPGSETVLAAMPSVSIESPDLEPAALFGTAVSLAGDVDDDGFADLVVGEPNVYVTEMGVSNRGRVHCYRGRSPLVDTTPSQSLSGRDGTFVSFGKSVSIGG